MNEEVVHLVTLCGQCDCGCPEVFVDPNASSAQRIVVTDDFGQRIQMSTTQFTDLIDRARSGELSDLLAKTPV